MLFRTPRPRAQSLAAERRGERGPGNEFSPDVRCGVCTDKRAEFRLWPPKVVRLVTVHAARLSINCHCDRRDHWHPFSTGTRTEYVQCETPSIETP